MNKSSRWRRGLAALAALGVATIGFALPATAAEAPANNPATIDVSKDGQAELQIHKLLNPTGTPTEGNGLPDSNATGTPLAGIEFQITKVPNIDLKTEDGWKEATDLTADQAKGQINAADTISKTTDTNGLADFTDLPFGLYYVHENLTAAQLAEGITGAEDFLVTLPLTHPTDQNSWLYTVHVYPKNSKSAIDKTVEDAGATTIGDTVTWDIKADIPSAKETDHYSIEDQLDSRLDYTGATVTLSDGTAIALGTDFTVTPAAGTANGPKVTITFTAEGLKKLFAAKSADPTAQVLVKLDTTVNASVATGDGIIKNQAVLFPNNASTTTGGVPSPEPETKWGSIDILKKSDKGDLLKGAVFSVFASEADAKAGTNPISVNGETEFTTNDQGVVNITGLRVTNWENGQVLNPERNYWLVEVKAPDGYELQTAPKAVTVHDNDTTVIDYEITNYPHNAGFHLPLTGGLGTWLFIAGGAGIILLAGGLYLRARGRRATA